MGSTVYIVLLNWNGWKDTIECCESLFRLHYSRFRVIVCDNGSTDDSLRCMRLWAQGSLAAVPQNPQLAHLVVPAIQKPIQFCEYGNENFEDRPGDPNLVLIATGSNLGFAGGCNVGLRYALAQQDCGYIWLLNNDTVVCPDSLSKQLGELSEHPQAGICGSTLFFYDDPTLVQALGGASFNTWNARSRLLGTGLRITHVPDAKVLGPQIDYISGASMLVRREFAERVGLLNESYFLYFEEIDWITRARGSFTLAYSPSSKVYHKEGRSTGSSELLGHRSSNSTRYGTRNRILFTSFYYPLRLPIVLLWVAAASVQRMLAGHVAQGLTMVRAIMEGVMDGFRFRIDSRRHRPAAGTSVDIPGRIGER